ncbi:MAG: hypothetical protein ACR2KJ_00355 [Jatrophihabitans sp.]
MTSTTDVTARLAELRDEYTYRVNLLLDEGREDLAARVADEYSDAAGRVLLGRAA